MYLRKYSNKFEIALTLHSLIEIHSVLVFVPELGTAPSDLKIARKVAHPTGNISTKSKTSILFHHFPKIVTAHKSKTKRL